MALLSPPPAHPPGGGARALGCLLPPLHPPSRRSALLSVPTVCASGAVQEIVKMEEKVVELSDLCDSGVEQACDAL